MLTEVCSLQDSFLQIINNGKGNVQDHVAAIDKD